MPTRWVGRGLPRKNQGAERELQRAAAVAAKIDLYVNARSEQEAIEKAEEIMYNHLEYSDVLRPNVPDWATGLDIDEVYCNISSAIEME